MTNVDSERDGPTHQYANVLGVQISAVNMAQALDLADKCVLGGGRGYMCLTGVHGVMEAFNDPSIERILNRAVINAPDGMPMTWVGWLQGLRKMDRVFGPDFMSELCRFSVERGYRHYLYGGRPGVAEALRDRLTAKIDGLRVVGTYTPPFRELNEQEETELLLDIQRTRPDIIWVGLSTPRQEQFMSRWSDRSRVPLMIGVGAAFDYHTGRILDCSPWVKRAGLQWVHRLMQDPRRLWRRYLRTHPAFVWHIMIQMLKLRRYPDRGPYQPEPTSRACCTPDRDRDNSLTNA